MNKEDYIKQLKKTPRDNTLFYRRRINRGDGKKTLGWIMQNNSKSILKENINILTLKEELKWKMLCLT